MHEPQSWRELLATIIRDPNERERIAENLGIHPLTLSRWSSGVSHPRLHNLQLLLHTLPDYREPLRELLAQEYVEFFADNDLKNVQKNVQEIEGIPSSLYARVLDAYTTTPSSLRSLSVLNCIMQNMLSHFDPTQSGIRISVAQCVAPNEQDQHIRSLRTIMHCETPPFPSLEPQSMLLGAESLVGYAVMSSRMVVIQDASVEKSFLPVHNDITIERSIASCPIMLGNEFVGCVMVSSTEPQYFTALRSSLIQQYVQLLTLAFNPTDFYPFDMFELRVMPTYQKQQPYLQQFRASTHKIMMESIKQGQKAMTVSQAEALAWKELEQKLLELPLEYSLQEQEELPAKPEVVAATDTQ